jgi:hypothetical protein
MVMDFDGSISTELALYNNKEEYNATVTHGLPLGNGGENPIATIHRALDLGVNFLDTPPNRDPMRVALSTRVKKAIKSVLYWSIPYGIRTGKFCAVQGIKSGDQGNFRPDQGIPLNHLALRNQLGQQLQPLGVQLNAHQADPCTVAARPGETRDQA